MAIGLSDRVWSVLEYVRYPVHAGDLTRAIWAEEREHALTWLVAASWSFAVASDRLEERAGVRIADETIRLTVDTPSGTTSGHARPLDLQNRVLHPNPGGT